MERPEIRRLTAEDWTVWRDVRLRSLTDAPDAFGSKLADWQGTNDREHRWRERFDHVAFNAVAVVGDTVCGAVGGMHTKRPDAVELVSMWVAPEQRGRGVGEALVGAVVDWAASHAMAELRLAVRRDNAHAISLYVRAGFRRDGAHPGHADEELMIRPLGGRTR